MAIYQPVGLATAQRISAQLIYGVEGQELALSTSDASESVPTGATSVILYCGSSDFYWQLDAEAVAGDGGGAFATAGTLFEFNLHPDVSSIHAILASGTATLHINFLKA